MLYSFEKKIEKHSSVHADLKLSCLKLCRAGPHSAVGSVSDSRVRGPGFSIQPHTFVSPSADSRRAVVSYWRKYMHKVLVNRLGGLGLPRKSVVRLIS